MALSRPARSRRSGSVARVRYGAHREQVADLWLPDGAGPHPVVVSLHGGYFQAGYGRDLHKPMAQALTGHGLAVLNVEYRRAGAGGSFEETTADVLSAVSTLGDLRLAGRVPVRPGAVAVGHSAGGYLALWAGRHPDVELVVGLAPVCDLVAAVHGGYDSGSVASWMGSVPAADPERYGAADLLAALPIRTPAVLVHGTADRTVPPEQSMGYAQAALAAGDRCDLVLLEGSEHFAVIEPGTEDFETWLAVVLGWAGR